MQLFISNRHEELYEFLKVQLFAGDTSSHPFAKRIVSTPHTAMRSWLQQKCACDPEWGIAMGITFTSEEQVIRQLAGDCEKRIPSRLELSFALEQLISRNPDPFFEEQLGCNRNSRKARRRILALSDTLATLFERYGLYGGQLIPQGWQKQLWDTLFSPTSGWTYPYHWLESSQTPPNLDDRTIHLFCPSSIPRLHLAILERAAKQATIYLYMISPCQMFWTDQLSGRERSRLQTYWQRKGASEVEQHQLSALLHDTNPLLAQLGKVGRQTASELETAEVLTTESYPHAAAPYTLLQALQTDFLVLRNPSHEPPVDIDEKYPSIEIHAAPSPAREVQILYDTLLKLLTCHEHASPPLQCADILVMVPDLRGYAPFLEATFGAHDSVLPYRLMDLSLLDASPFVQAFLHLIALAQGNWEATALVQLFQSPYLQKRYHLSEGDVEQLRSWIQTAPILWGEDMAHRDAILKKAHCRQGMADANAVGTWEQGIQTLVESLTQEPTSEVVVNPSEAALLGSFLTIIQSLRDDLRPLKEGTKLTLCQWVDYLDCLCNAYLSPTDRTSSSHYDLLNDTFNRMRQANDWDPNALFPFDSVQLRLQTLIERQSVARNEGDLHAIRMCSLRPQRATPARVVALLGMQEGAFPRTGGGSPLDQLKLHPKADYCPTDGERDRYLFLECLLSARENLIISYSNLSAVDGREQYPCLPVAELGSYLNNFYRLSQQPAGVAIHRQHPFYPFDPSYFCPQTTTQSYSQHYYRAAQTILHPQPTDTTTLLHVPKVRASSRPAVVDLRELAILMRDPIQLYMNKTLGIYLSDSRRREVNEQEPFTLSSREKHQLRSEALREPLERVLARAKSRGNFPLGTFGATALEQLKSDLQPAVAMNLTYAPRIQLQIGCQRPTEMRPGLWHIPAIQIGNQSITGTLDRISLQGLVAEGEGGLEDTVKVWPSYLLLQALAPYIEEVCGQSIPSRLHFLGKGRSQTISIHSPGQHLEDLLAHYQQCLAQASPLHADWSKLFLAGNSQATATRIEKDLREETRYRHARWILGTPPREQLERWVDCWISNAQRLYSPLNEASYAVV